MDFVAKIKAKQDAFSTMLNVIACHVLDQTLIVENVKFINLLAF